MDTSSTISLLVGIIGTGIVIYQWAVLNESKKRQKELQFLLAGISNAVLSKQQTWINQMGLLPPPQTEANLGVMRVHARARDDLSEIHSLVSALEGTIDTENSAITAILEKTLKQGEINNKIQKTALANPTLAKQTSVLEMESEH